MVESRSGKKRLVINLRYINSFLATVKFKYEDMRTAMMLFEKDDYLCTFDLKSGYHHVDIHPVHSPFWVFSGNINTTCLLYSPLGYLQHATF